MLRNNALRSLLARAAQLLGLTILLTASCGSDDIETLVLVDYAGVPVDASGLTLLYFLGNHDGVWPSPTYLNMGNAVSPNTGKFAFRLPAEAKGKELTIRIAVSKSGWRCLGGGGQNDQPIQLKGQPQVNVFICVTNVATDGGTCDTFPAC